MECEAAWSTPVAADSRQKMVDGAMALLLQAMAEVWGAPADQVVARFLAIWRAVLTRSRFEAGCAVLAVTVAAGSAELLDHAAQVFRQWQQRLAEGLQRGGLPPELASGWATLLIASAEGAVVLCRAEHSLAPFEAVAEQLTRQTRAWLPSAGASRLGAV